MKKLAIMGLAMLGLSACAELPVPPEVINVGCILGPSQFPEYAAEIAIACDLYGTETVRLVVE